MKNIREKASKSKKITKFWKYKFFQNNYLNMILDNFPINLY